MTDIQLFYGSFIENEDGLGYLPEHTRENEEEFEKSLEENGISIIHFSGDFYCIIGITESLTKVDEYCPKGLGQNIQSKTDWCTKIEEFCKQNNIPISNPEWTLSGCSD